MSYPADNFIEKMYRNSIDEVFILINGLGKKVASKKAFKQLFDY